MPFSDPLADGPSIQSAMVRSLSYGFRTEMLFQTVSKLRDEGVTVPIVVMTYYNPIVRTGVDAFCRQLSSAGADAILVVDLPIEESTEMDSAAADAGLDIIRLVAPRTDDERAARIMSMATGFVYAVSVSGVTGAKEALPETALTLLRRLRAINGTTPVALGFGISNRTQVEEAMAAGASGVVEGSALINLYSQSSTDIDSILSRIERHSADIKEATRPHVSSAGR